MEELFQELENSRKYSEELQTDVIPAEIVYEVFGKVVEQHIQNTFEMLSVHLTGLSKEVKDTEE